MNWEKLFEIQAGLDERIVEIKGLQGQDLLDKKILALQVELGELANEWRGFKFWSEDQKPRTKKCIGGLLDDEFKYKNPLLEEYVDCLHFILSIGLEQKDLMHHFPAYPHKQDNITDQFIELNYQTYRVLQKTEINNGEKEWYLLSDLLLGLGEMLGFTEQQIEQAYLDKNKINHERQNTGY